MATVQQYSELTGRDTFDNDAFSSNGEFYPVFKIGKDVVGRFIGSIDDYLGNDRADYFVLDLEASGLKAGDELFVSFFGSSGTDLSIRFGAYTYEYLKTFGLNYNTHLLSNEKTRGSLIIPEGVDVISFQVWSISDFSGTYQVDMLHHPKLRTLLNLKGIGDRPELFRASDATEPVEVLAGDGNDFARTGKAADVIFGGLGRDIAVGLDGNDFIYGYGKSDISGLGAKDGADQLLGGRGNDKMFGGAGGDYMHGEWNNDTLKGEDGNDLMQGGYGGDVMDGGNGNDLMYGGTETKLRGDWFGEALTLTWDGTTGKTMTPQKWSIPGEVQADDKSSDRMSGGNGDDGMWGQGGNDTMKGGAGKDKIDGGSGNDAIDGGSGSDVIHAGSGDDAIVDSGGSDKSYGEAGNDTYAVREIMDSYERYFSGGTGTDTVDFSKLQGLKPEILVNDKYVDIRGYTVDEVFRMELEGVEIIRAGSGDDQIRMNADDNTINGNGGNDKINGGGGDDKLYGGSGKDALVGGSGKDMFVFNTKLGATNVDTIGDFSVKKDKIVLDDDVFKAGKVGDLSSGAFSTGTKAQDASDRIIYDKASGKLWYDADGSGSGKAVLFGVLDKGLNLTAGDFDIIS